MIDPVRRVVNRPILAVDDDEAILDLVQMALEDEGYGVLPAHDGAEALGLLRESNPSLILLDMRMPQVNGWEFAEAYRKFPAPHVPIVVMTAGRDARDAARDIGAACHIGKPFDVDNLIDVVRLCLERSNA